MKKVLILLIFALFSIKAYARNLPPPHVDALRIHLKDIPYSINYPAKAKASKDVVITAKISGELLKRYFKEGSFVKKGQLLFLIDPSIYQAEVNSIKAQIQAQEAIVAKTEKDFKRSQKAFLEKLISPEAFDKALSSYKSALATLKMLKAKLKLAQIKLSYTRIKAPISGITSLVYKNCGNYITGGMPLLKIIKIDPIYVYFSISDKDYFKMAKQLKSGKIKVFIKKINQTGIIDYISKSIDPSTSTVKLRAVFKNHKNNLLDNEFVNISLTGLKYHNAAVIPQTSLIQNGPISMVFVVKNNHPIPQVVKIIGQKGLNFIIKGLHEGDLVIIDNLIKLRGAKKVIIDRIVDNK
ncbi:efflux RND transporter periplasmic adaptor subunit [Hippea jasoniae]|uniref:efflux RND transporter periplasmic adaptor subunit n=1 Tax=Hippea jasoniae TaxID=944479 RepID=UPI00054D438B|nr:efflux RND transporter periplasmic adaptor subunit [Hippea jasoniae]